MVDLQKPCVRCGSTNRFPCGTCIDCRKARKAKAMASGSPCKKCGATDRYATGDCRPCSRIYRSAPAIKNKPCNTCGKADRFPSGQCKKCQKQRRMMLAANKIPCKNCGSIRRWNISGMCSVCGAAKAEKYRSSDGFFKWQKAYMASEKRHKTNVKANQKSARLGFEFSLQTQRRVIEQCQQKST